MTRKAKRIESIEDLRSDPANANKGTERGIRVLDDSLRKYGAGRSILADKHGVVIAGNKTLETAVDIGLPIRTVETDGKELVVVQRTDLDLSQGGKARELAYADNRSSEVSLEWNFDQIKADLEAGVNFEGLWSQDELGEMLGDLQGDNDAGRSALVDFQQFNVAGELDLTEIEKQLFAGKKHVVCSYSGGVDSSMALIWAARNFDPQTVYAAYVDIGVEFPAMAYHTKQVAKFLGVQHIILKPKKDFFCLLDEKGWPFHQFPWCQEDLLHLPVDAFAAELGSPEDILQIGGGNKGEAKPASGKTQLKEYRGYQVYFPMFEWTKEQVQEKLYASGIPIWWGYKLGFPRTACYMCPGGRQVFYSALRKWFPGLWRVLLEWEAKKGVGKWSPSCKDFSEMADRGEPELSKFLEHVKQNGFPPISTASSDDGKKLRKRAAKDSRDGIAGG
jgi:3'-phosphoadenosine 5'-phosphosulfate sulfotransferase (PAPS reductase)/FAD synthetase